jgi:hypothetical protein
VNYEEKRFLLLGKKIYFKYQIFGVCNFTVLICSFSFKLLKMTQSNCLPILADKCTARVYDVIVHWHMQVGILSTKLRRLRSSHVMILHLWPLFCCKNYNLITFQALLGVSTDSLLVFLQCTALGINLFLASLMGHFFLR